MNLGELLHWADSVTTKHIDIAPINQRFNISFKHTKDNIKDNVEHIITKTKNNTKNNIVSILDNTWPIHNTHWKLPRNSTNISILQYISKNLTFNYTKYELQFIMKYFETLTEIEWTQWKPLLYTLIDINFFRDSYRAEVAIQTNSIFITIDRFAYLYYDLQASTEDNNNLHNSHAMCMFGEKNNVSLYIQ
jgi:hypothetical protein